MSVSSVQIDHVQIAMPENSESQARYFFSELLGLKEIPKPVDMAKRGGCWFEVGDQQLHCGVEPNFRPALKAHIALSVDHLDELRAKLEIAGHITHDDNMIEGRNRFFTKDPFGNRIEFMDKI